MAREDLVGAWIVRHSYWCSQFSQRKEIQEGQLVFVTNFNDSFVHSVLPCINLLWYEGHYKWELEDRDRLLRLFHYYHQRIEEAESGS